MALVRELRDSLLGIAVQMAETETPGRDEASFGQIAQRLGELGELSLMRSLNAHRERLLTALRMGAPAQPSPKNLEQSWHLE